MAVENGDAETKEGENMSGVGQDRPQPPQALEVEQAVLGAILKDPEALNAILEVIRDPYDFYAPKHQMIFQAALGHVDMPAATRIEEARSCIANHDLLIEQGTAPEYHHERAYEQAKDILALAEAAAKPREEF